jgi:hypothetical protein
MMPQANKRGMIASRAIASGSAFHANLAFDPSLFQKAWVPIKIAMSSMQT